MLSFGKDGVELEASARPYGAGSGTPAEAARFGAAVLLSVPWGVVELALRQAGSREGKILCDCANALTADFTGPAVGTITRAARSSPGWRRARAWSRACRPRLRCC